VTAIHSDRLSHHLATLPLRDENSLKQEKKEEIILPIITTKA
jgi:hypothetical protein